MNKISDTNLETASLETLRGISTASMMEAAENYATKKLEFVSDPVIGSRENLIASYLRSRLTIERTEIKSLFDGLNKIGSN